MSAVQQESRERKSGENRVSLVQCRCGLYWWYPHQSECLYCEETYEELHEAEVQVRIPRRKNGDGTHLRDRERDSVLRDDEGRSDQDLKGSRREAINQSNVQPRLATV